MKKKKKNKKLKNLNDNERKSVTAPTESYTKELHVDKTNTTSIDGP